MNKLISLSRRRQWAFELLVEIEKEYQEHLRSGEHGKND
jgi:hypothetical protein